MKRFLVLAFAISACAGRDASRGGRAVPTDTPWPRWAPPSAFPFPASTKFPAAPSSRSSRLPARPLEERWGDRLRSRLGQDRGRGQPAGGRRKTMPWRSAGRRAAAPASWKSPTPINAASSSGAITGRSPSSRPRWNKPRSWRSISATATAAAPARSFLGLQHARAGAIGRGGGRRSGQPAPFQAQFDQVQQGPYTRAGRMPMAVHGQQLQGRRPQFQRHLHQPARRQILLAGTGRQDRVSDTLARARQRQRAAVDAVVRAPAPSPCVRRRPRNARVVLATRSRS